MARCRPTDRPQFVLFGESLGSQVSQEMFEGTGTTGPDRHRPGRGRVDRHPGATTWRKQLWGDADDRGPAAVGPGDIYLPRTS